MHPKYIEIKYISELTNMKMCIFFTIFYAFLIHW